MAEAQTPVEGKKPFADILLNVGRPSLSAESDAPVIEVAKPAKEQAIDEQPLPVDTGNTSDKPEGEVDAQPPAKAESGGEEKDQTSPQQRAAFARERNKRQAAEQRANAIETRFAELSQKLDQVLEEKKPKEDPRPTRETFADPETYDQALEGWAGRRAAEAAKAEAKVENERQSQERQRQAVLDKFNERRTSFEADHADFEDVAFSDDLKVSPAMTQAILEAEDGPAIIYHLGNNPEVAERLAGLSPAQAVYEIGKISARLSTPPPKRQEPPRPVQARNSAGPKDPNDMNMAEFVVWRAERDKKTN